MKWMKSWNKIWKQNRTRLVFIVAILLIVAGIVTGQPQAVWIKASKICLECIGIG